MKKLFVTALLATAGIANAGHTVHDHGLIFGGAVQLGNYSEDGYDSVAPVGGLINLERPLTSLLSVRGDFAFGLESDSVEVGTVEVDFSLERMFSGFLKFNADVTDSVQLYGLIGVSKGEFRMELTDSDTSTSDSDAGLSYGLGAAFGLGDGVMLTGEYISYLSEDTYDYSGINIGLAKRF